MPALSSVCIFCGSSAGSDPVYAETARAVGAGLAERGLRLVYGGGRVGLMGAVADGALAAGGDVVGVIPEQIVALEVGHRGLGDDLRVVGSMHERKALMAELADAFIALPGGIGTFEELFEIFTWAQLGLHRKPLGLLDVAGYYQPLAAMLDHAVSAGFLRPQTRAMLMAADTLDTLLDRFEDWLPTGRPMWLDREAT
ncbi:MAG: hypothetical protein QOH46_3492 [Solirubrobacteraceae bacterium]|nr:hypothetical protein [Solirubrobacteraceae bacterium]